VIKANGYQKVVAQTYLAGPNGTTVKGVDLSWVAPVLFLAYLIVFQSRSGQTLGLRLMGSRLLMPSNPNVAKVPLLRIITRYAVMLGGFFPAALVAFYLSSAARNAPNDAPLPFAGIAPLIVVILGLGWPLWNIVLIARKQDPIFDRVAGTAVVHL
jgi:hypothetical protein